VFELDVDVQPTSEVPVDNLNFDGRVAIVTGAGGGLGRCHALSLAARGARLVVNDLGGSTDGIGSSDSPADRVVKEILDAGGEAVASADSVATPAGARALVQTALDAYATVDIVVNNAGILRDRSFAKLTAADFEAVLDVHLRGTFHVSQAAFTVMKDNSYGRFVHTTSSAGLFGNFGQGNYAAAKCGVVGLSNVIAIEGAKYGIRSNVIAPMAKTRLTESLLGPLADVLGPEQVTPLVTYLSSERCDLTHEIFSVGGGRYGRIFLGLTPGWFAGKGVEPSPEDIESHLGEILDVEDYIIPASVTDEMTMLLGQMQG
jgi:NAD(P)-dependent dehydrogenase (short-subunit alcohol dehydrogenase family)